MKKVYTLALFAVLGLSYIAFGIESSVIKNTTNGTVFSISYTTGKCVVAVDGVVNADSFTPAVSYASGNVTAGKLTVQTNATIGGTLGVTGISSLLGVTSDSATLGKLTVQTNATITGAASANSATIGGLTVTTNATVGGTLGITGQATLTAAPKFLVEQAVTGTIVSAAAIQLPEGATTNGAKLIKVSIGTTNYVIPVYQVN